MPLAVETFTAELNGDLIEIRAGSTMSPTATSSSGGFPIASLPIGKPSGDAVTDRPASLCASRSLQPRCWTLTSERLRVPGLTAGRRCGRVRRGSPLRWGRRRDARSRLSSCPPLATAASKAAVGCTRRLAVAGTRRSRFGSRARRVREHDAHRSRTSLRPTTTRMRNSSQASAPTSSVWATGIATPVGTPGRATETSTLG
jgi:hypothetical protein